MGDGGHKKLFCTSALVSAVLDLHFSLSITLNQQASPVLYKYTSAWNKTNSKLMTLIFLFLIELTVFHDPWSAENPT